MCIFEKKIQLGGLDITASRNLYGRQRESFVTSLSITNEEVRKSLVGSGDYSVGVVVL